ncbi:hypothetical protein TELCIR_06853, partial [Teladorsagia circumcincta]
AFFLGLEIEHQLGHFPFNGISDTHKGLTQEFMTHLRLYSNLIDDKISINEDDFRILFNESMEKYFKEVVRELSYADETALESPEVSSPSTSARRSVTQMLKGRKSICVGNVPSIILQTEQSSSEKTMTAATEGQSHVDGEKTSSSDDIQIVEDVHPKPRFRNLSFLKRKYLRKEVGASAFCMLCGLERLTKRLKETPTDPLQKKIFFSCLVMDKVPATYAIRLYEEKYSGDGHVCAHHYAQAAFFVAAQTRRRPREKFSVEGLEHLPYSTLKSIADRFRSYGVVKENEDLSPDDIIKFYKYCRSLFSLSPNADNEVSPNSCSIWHILYISFAGAVSAKFPRDESGTSHNPSTVEDEPLFLDNSSSKMTCEEERIPLKIVKEDDSTEAAANGSSESGSKGTRKRRNPADDCEEVKTEFDERIPDEDDHSTSSVEEIDEQDGEMSPDDSKLRRRSSKDGVRRAMMKANPNKKFKDLVKELFANPPAPRKRERTSQKSSETLENYIRKEDQLCNRLEICSSLYLRNRRREFLDRIIVYEEKWIVYDYTYRNVGRLGKKSDPKEKAETSDISTKRRSMLTVWWSSYGVILHRVLSSSPSKESRTFTSYIRDMNKCLLEQQPWLVHGPAPIFLYDSSCGYISNAVIHIMCRFGFECLPYPYDSVYLSPHTSYVSTHFGNYLQNRKEQFEEVDDAFRDFLKTKPPSFFKEGLAELPTRWKNCINSRGDLLG